MQDTRAARDTATTPIAIYAVAQHMLDQRLPGPIGIHGPRVCPGAERTVRVDVYAADLDRWVESTDAEYLSTYNTTINGERFALVTYAGRVSAAIGDVSVVIRIAQRVDAEVRSLTLVGGESA